MRACQIDTRSGELNAFLAEVRCIGASAGPNFNVKSSLVNGMNLLILHENSTHCSGPRLFLNFKAPLVTCIPLNSLRFLDVLARRMKGRMRTHKGSHWCLSSVSKAHTYPGVPSTPGPVVWRLCADRRHGAGGRRDRRSANPTEKTSKLSAQSES